MSKLSRHGYVIRKKNYTDEEIDSVKKDLTIGTYKLCFGCRMPLSKQNRKSFKFEKGVSCPKCFDKLSKNKMQRLRERNKQIEIAKRKGTYNPYIKYTPLNFL